MASSPLPSVYGFPYRWPGVANVIPFAVSPGTSYLELLELYRAYIVGLVPEFEDTVNSIYDEMKKFGENLEGWTQENYNTFVDRTTALVNEINNRVGPTDVKHVTVSGATPLPYSNLWPNNHVIWYEIKVGDTGGTLTLPTNFTGNPLEGVEHGQTVLVGAKPDGLGNYTLFTDDSMTLEAWERQGGLRGALDNAYVSIADERYVDVKRYGAVGDGVTDDTAAVAAAMVKVGQMGGGTLYFPPGTYYMKHYVDLVDNVRILGDGATLIKRLGMSAYSFFNADSKSPKYGGSVSNVIMENMRFKGDVSNSVGCAAMVLHHAYNVKVSKCDFIEMVVTGHVFDLIGSDNIKIDSCNFYGASVAADSEAIQIDVSMMGTGGTGVRSGLPTRRVKITNCNFAPAVSADLIEYPAPNPMGAHAFREGAYYDDVLFEGNTVTNPRTRVVTASNFVGIIRGGMARRWNIVNNTFITAAGAPSARVIALQGITSGWLANSDPNSESAEKDTFPGVGVVSDCIIMGNQFIGWGGVGNWDDTIYLTEGRNVKVEGNLFKGCGNALDVRGGSMITVANNTYSYAPASLAGFIIGLNGCHDSTVASNTVIANSSINEAPVLIWGGTDTTYVYGNNVKGKGSASIGVNSGSSAEVGANYLR